MSPLVTKKVTIGLKNEALSALSTTANVDATWLVIFQNGDLVSPRSSLHPSRSAEGDLSRSGGRAAGQGPPGEVRRRQGLRGAAAEGGPGARGVRSPQGLPAQAQGAPRHPPAPPELHAGGGYATATLQC